MTTFRPALQREHAKATHTRQSFELSADKSQPLEPNDCIQGLTVKASRNSEKRACFIARSAFTKRRLLPPLVPGAILVCILGLGSRSGSVSEYWDPKMRSRLPRDVEMPESEGG